jgi:transposase-like protein
MMTYKDLAFFSPPQSAKGSLHTLKVILDEAAPKAVDEKWITIAGVWWYLFVAVDHVSGLPLPVALLPSNATPYCALFLLQLKALGYRPKVIITDGWDAYGTAIARVFPHAQHLFASVWNNVWWM